MAPSEKGSAGAGVAIVVLGVLALLIYGLCLAGLSDLASSDAAGNAYSQAYTAIALIALWLLLAVIALVAFVKGGMPPPAAMLALVLIPVSGFVSLEALELLSRPNMPPFLWPMIIPAGVPPLVYAFCLWALLPQLRAAIPAPFAATFVWGSVAILCVAIVAFDQTRANFRDREAAKIAQMDADYASRPADAPLWDLVRFLDTPNTSKSNGVIERIGKLQRRQNDAELMLDRGDFPLGYLGRFDLTPTQSICDKARALLRRRVEPLALPTPNSKPYRDIFGPVNDAVAAMTWLVGHECSCDAEAQAWQAMAEAYRDPGFGVVELRQLREPGRLGQQMREFPERFDMLTPKSHLRAWLKFADEPELRDQALSGARKLDHRTTDAVQMLRESDYSGWPVLKYLPALDLEASPQLCRAALTAVHRDVSKVYRPKDDDARPYSELLERLGAYRPLTALVWLAGHGCEAEPELSEAEEVIGAYQDSPQRAAMLGTLERLHRR